MAKNRANRLWGEQAPWVQDPTGSSIPAADNDLAIEHGTVSLVSSVPDAELEQQRKTAVKDGPGVASMDDQLRKAKP